MRGRLILFAASTFTAAAIAQGWRFYRELYPCPIMFAKTISSEEDLDLLDGTASIVLSDELLQGPKGIFYKTALSISNRMISARAMVVKGKWNNSRKKGKMK